MLTLRHNYLIQHCSYVTRPRPLFPKNSPTLRLFLTMEEETVYFTPGFSIFIDRESVNLTLLLHEADVVTETTKVICPKVTQHPNPSGGCGEN